LEFLPILRQTEPLVQNAMGASEESEKAAVWDEGVPEIGWGVIAH
jgi:hypothetical protein